MVIYTFEKGVFNMLQMQKLKLSRESVTDMNSTHPFALPDIYFLC